VVGASKCQTRGTVWRAGGACPNGRKRPVLWAVHRSGPKWVQAARSASLILLFGRREELRLIRLERNHLFKTEGARQKRIRKTLTHCVSNGYGAILGPLLGT
jgi:hypothetical protein